MSYWSKPGDFVPYGTTLFSSNNDKDENDTKENAHVASNAHTKNHISQTPTIMAYWTKSGDVVPPYGTTLFSANNGVDEKHTMDSSRTETNAYTTQRTADIQEPAGPWYVTPAGVNAPIWQKNPSSSGPLASSQAMAGSPYASSNNVTFSIPPSSLPTTNRPKKIYQLQHEILDKVKVSAAGRIPSAEKQFRVSSTEAARRIVTLSENPNSPSYQGLETMMETKALAVGGVARRREFFQYLQRMRDKSRQEHGGCSGPYRAWMADKLTWERFYPREPFPGKEPRGSEVHNCHTNRAIRSKTDYTFTRHANRPDNHRHIAQPVNRTPAVAASCPAGDRSHVIVVKGAHDWTCAGTESVMRVIEHALVMDPDRQLVEDSMQCVILLERNDAFRTLTITVRPAISDLHPAILKLATDVFLEWIKQAIKKPLRLSAFWKSWSDQNLRHIVPQPEKVEAAPAMTPAPIIIPAVIRSEATVQSATEVK
ncbi:hypothetical protein BJ878DRAFT_162337 [Calycina marina]|uniref:Uncharacterized protein n=1 Tax=Calycina marina TaxID=1763456 RepID=A0A9P7YZD8_9HELO|nr:hypothetical protein BJ878DRAFT_162337 [Calycina marina]